MVIVGFGSVHKIEMRIEIVMIIPLWWFTIRWPEVEAMRRKKHKAAAEKERSSDGEKIRKKRSDSLLGVKQKR